MTILINLHCAPNGSANYIEHLLVKVPDGELAKAQEAISAGHDAWLKEIKSDKTVEDFILEALDNAGVHYDTLGYEEIEIIDLDCSMEE